MKTLDYNLIDNVMVDGIATNQYPEFEDAFIESAGYDGVEMTEEQLYLLNEDCEFIHESVYKHLF